jgi:high-affinity Fe2+/Pb2+ permease
MNTFGSQKSARPTAVIRVGITFALIGLALAVSAVTVLVHAVHRSIGLGIFGLVAASLFLFVAGYMFWAYRYLQKHPERFPQATYSAKNQSADGP